MSVDQTFHTPSFGDEEFEIPPLTYAPTAAASRCSGQGVFGNQVPVEYLKRKLSCDQIYVYLPRHEENYTDCSVYNDHSLSHLRSPEPHHQQQQQQGYLVHSNSPQGHIMNNNQFHNGPPQQQSRGPQNMYQNMMNTHSMGMQMQYENHTGYPDASLQQGSHQQMQMTLMHHQQQQPQQNHVMGPPQQQMYTTINQSQISSQLGLQIGMQQQQQSGSPPGSNHNSPGVESSEDSDDSTPLAQLIGAKKLLTPEPVDTTVPKVTKKPKAQKKKKKRDPNEPQKPVSAYALFFRDTQAAIKGQSPNASFGEVSKIVASMWDSLDIERKNSYKKRTETAKKEYLKALAAYRANLVSKAAVDQSDSMFGNNATNSSPPSTHSPNSSPPGRMVSMQKQLSPVLTSVVDSMQPVTNSINMHPQNQQVWQMQSPPHMTNTSPPHVMQGGNGMMGMQQQQQQQQQSMQPHMSPPQMGMMNRPPVQMPVNSPPMCNSASNSPSYNQNMTSVNSAGNHANMGTVDMMSSLPTCLRNGCSNPAIDSPDWDREYCSSECVVSHCKDVFATWVAQRQQPANPYSTVK
ncbi:TOX high mobility group box family member 4-B [Nephila pilipes]|uniref:TOX high mobility group box family member 4-B n=1 Tax=Nephila pilipes TaxID=299642 RepID=A0A8X6QIA3_NEPPI|nr:TOX high mobility group box family member 4-B [Nephila pilipes]GFU15967.1 TOX high mobility group box family member 4-B [Nephila pilipes]